MVFDVRKNPALDSFRLKLSTKQTLNKCSKCTCLDVVDTFDFIVQMSGVQSVRVNL